MQLRLKEILQMVTVPNNENALALLKAEIEYINNDGQLDMIDELSPADKDELIGLINNQLKKTL